MPWLRMFCGIFISCLFKIFWIGDCNIFLSYPPKTSFDAHISSRTNYISKYIFTKNHAIHLILFICTRVFKFFTIPYNKCKKVVQRKPAFSIDKLILELDFLCLRYTNCALTLFIWGVVLFLYIQCYLRAYSVLLARVHSF